MGLNPTKVSFVFQPLDLRRWPATLSWRNWTLSWWRPSCRSRDSKRRETSTSGSSETSKCSARYFFLLKNSLRCCSSLYLFEKVDPEQQFAEAFLFLKEGRPKPQACLLATLLTGLRQVVDAVSWAHFFQVKGLSLQWGSLLQQVFLQPEFCFVVRYFLYLYSFSVSMRLIVLISKLNRCLRRYYGSSNTTALFACTRQLFHSSNRLTIGWWTYVNNLIGFRRSIRQSLPRRSWTCCTPPRTASRCRRTKKSLLPLKTRSTREENRWLTSSSRPVTSPLVSPSAKKWTVVKQVIRGISFQTQRDLMRELFFWLSTCDWPVCCQATLATNVISPFAFNLLTWQHRQLIFYYIAFSSFTIAITLTSNTPLTPRFLTEPKRFSGFKDNHNFVIL